MAAKKKTASKKASAKGKSAKAKPSRVSAKPAKQTDVLAALADYSKANAYAAHHFAEAECACGGHSFLLQVDDNQGAAIRTCVACKASHPIGDSDEFLEGADLEECACPCGGDAFAITVGVSLYDGSDDVRWLYLGCKCSTCGLAAVYADWKNEFNGYRELLARI